MIKDLFGVLFAIIDVIRALFRRQLPTPKRHRTEKESLELYDRQAKQRALDDWNRECQRTFTALEREEMMKRVLTRRRINVEQMKREREEIKPIK